jgi:SOS response regulatory protein OraA/RecX
LDRRGVAVAVIDEYLYEDDTDWLQIIDSLVTKKMPNEVKIEFASKQHKKILWFLQARGFSALEASRVLSEKLLNKWGQNK